MICDQNYGHILRCFEVHKPLTYDLPRRAPARSPRPNNQRADHLNRRNRLAENSHAGRSANTGSRS